MSYQLLRMGMPISVDFPQCHQLAQKAIDGFRAFLREIPMEKRNIFTFLPGTTEEIPAVDHEDAELGYFLRNGRRHSDRKYDGVGGTYDRKDLWHYVPRIWDELGKRNVALSPETELWLRHCHELFEECQRCVYNFARQEHLRPTGLLEALHSAERGPLGHTHALRLINYHRQSADEPMGHGHTDRDTFTLHVAEKWPAMHCSKSHRLFKAQPDKALLFPGDKADRFLGIPAFDHYVHDTTGRSKEEERWVVVFFAHTNPSP